MNHYYLFCLFAIPAEVAFIAWEVSKGSPEYASGGVAGLVVVLVLLCQEVAAERKETIRHAEHLERMAEIRGGRR